MLENLLSLGLIPLIMVVGFSPTWLATLYLLFTKLKIFSSYSSIFSPVSVIALASYASVVVTFCMLFLYAMAHSGI
jgi:hypothetical protein